MSTPIGTSDLSSLPETERATIPQDYLDIMGHMNVMWYTHLFSNATIRLFNRIGLTLEYMESTRSGSFALEAHVRYYREVRVGQEIAIHTRVLGRSAKRYHIMHFMSVEDELAATTEFVSAHIDMTRRRQSPMPPSITDALDGLLNEHRRLSWAAPVCGVMNP